MSQTDPYEEGLREINAAPSEERVTTAHRLYRTGWDVSASHFDTQRLYDWMARRLQPFRPQRILDIGCGLGHGVAAMVRVLAPKQIISLDENRECLSSASKRLRSQSAPVRVIKRMAHDSCGERKHLIRFMKGRLAIGNGVTLVESDILIDDELQQYLSAGRKFDAINISLIGSHFLRYSECANLDESDIQNPESYRYQV